jgi:hypothetical protein
MHQKRSKELGLMHENRRKELYRQAKEKRSQSLGRHHRTEKTRDESCLSSSTT